MQRAILWTLTMATALAFEMGADKRLLSQQIPDPTPIDGEVEIELELPSPVQTVDNSQMPRDYSDAFLGVTFDPRVRDAAVARSVSAGSPADQAGVKAGDTIVALNGQPTGTYDDVLKIVAMLKPGDVLDIEISRRISVRARAVLDGQPLDGQHTSSYRAEAEALPVPAGHLSQPRVIRTPTNASAPPPRQNYSTPQNRSGSVNRSGDSNERDRDNRVRGRFSRRRG